jgi:Uma2 family endonuclease
MATVWQANVDDLYLAKGKAELVNGELVHMHAGGDFHGTATLNISLHLHAHVKALGVGRVYGDNVGFLCDLPNRRSFSPDCAYYTGPRAGVKFLPQAPVLAVEVRSQEDYGPAAERQIAEKIEDYFAAGTLVVWDVDIKSREIRVHRAGSRSVAATFGVGQAADAEPAVPGWSFAVDELLS